MRKILSASILSFLLFGAVSLSDLEKGTFEVRDILEERFTNEATGRKVNVKRANDVTADIADSIKVQQRYDEETGTYDFRFVAGINSVEVDKASITVNMGGKTASKDIYKAYEKMMDGSTEKTASEVFGEGYNYFLAYVLADVPSSAVTSNFDVTVGLVSEDVTVDSATRNVTLSDIIDLDFEPSIEFSNNDELTVLAGSELTLPTYTVTNSVASTWNVEITSSGNGTIENGVYTPDVYAGEGTHTLTYTAVNPHTGKEVVLGYKNVKVYRKLFRNAPAAGTINELVTNSEQTVVVKDGGMTATRFSMNNSNVYYAEATFNTSYNVLAGLCHMGENGFSSPVRWLYMTLRPTDNFLNIKDNTGWTGGNSIEQNNVVGTMGATIESGYFKVGTARIGNMYYMFVNDQYLKSYTSDYYADMDTTPGIYINAYGDTDNVSSNGVEVTNIDFYSDAETVQEKVSSLTEGKMLMPYVPGLDYWTYSPSNYSFGYSEERGNYVDMTTNTAGQNSAIWSPQIYFGGSFSFEFDYTYESTSATGQTGRMWVELRKYNNGTAQVEFGAKYSMDDPQFMLDREGFINGGGTNPDDSTDGKYYQPTMSSLGVSKTDTFHYKITRTLVGEYSTFAMEISKTDGTVIATKTWENKGCGAEQEMSILVQNKQVKGSYSNVTWTVL